MNLSADDPGGFIDTLLSPAVVDPRVYISRQAVIDMARVFGLPDAAAYDELLDKVDELSSRVEQLTQTNTELERDVLSAEWTLERQFAAKIQAKPGRPKKVAA